MVAAVSRRSAVGGAYKGCPACRANPRCDNYAKRRKGVGKSKSVSRPGDNLNGFLRWRETDIPRQTPKFFKSDFLFFKHIPHTSRGEISQQERQ